jgi:transposase
MCLLASAAGQSAAAIARITGLSRNGITQIRRRWRKRRLASLIDRPRSGRPAQVTAEYRQLLRTALRRSPQAFGYAFTLWSIARLATHLEKQTGIVISRVWLRRLVHGESFVIGRPKRTLKGKRDQREFRLAQRKLQRLKRGPLSHRPATSCGTWTPASSAFTPTWFGAG